MDWTKAHPDMARHVLTVGDAYLEAQLGLATSADQRASVMASIYAAAAAVIIGGLITIADTVTGALLWPAGVTAVMFLVASTLCVWATLPADFYLPGNEPTSYKTEIEAGIDVNTALRDEVEHTQSKIDDNAKLLKKNARLFRAGAFLGIAAPVVGLLVWLHTLCAISSS
jgi:hypothetical protein